jgi:hypothetical protein
MKGQEGYSSRRKVCIWLCASCAVRLIAELWEATIQKFLRIQLRYRAARRRVLPFKYRPISARRSDCGDAADGNRRLDLLLARQGRLYRALHPHYKPHQMTQFSGFLIKD